MPKQPPEQPFSSTSGTTISKIPTHIQGLDDILAGGLPAGRTTLVSGSPGTGKSVFGLEFVCRRAQAGYPGMFVSFEEPADFIRQNALTLGWDLPALEQAGKVVLLDGRVQPDVLVAGDFNLKGFSAIMEAKMKQIGVVQIVIDALDMLMRFFEDTRRQQNEIFALNNWLRQQNLTTILTAKTDQREEKQSQLSYLGFMADCVISLDRRIRNQVNTRRLQILKYRGSDFAANEHPFFISGQGIMIAPVSNIRMDYNTSTEKISSGNAGFDRILGGGFRQGGCIMVSGATGIGKTALASTFALAACERGEKVLYITYEESRNDLKAGMFSLGIDLAPRVSDGSLGIIPVIPESMGIEEHFFHITRVIENLKPRHLIIDAVSAVKRIAGEEAAFDFLIRLSNTCRVKGITTFLVNQAAVAEDVAEISGIGISSVVDTVILMNYHLRDTEMGRRLLVLKARGTKHAAHYFDYRLTDHGILINDETG